MNVKTADDDDVAADDLGSLSLDQRLSFQRRSSSRLVDLHQHPSHNNGNTNSSRRRRSQQSRLSSHRLSVPFSGYNEEEKRFSHHNDTNNN